MENQENVEVKQENVEVKQTQQQDTVKIDMFKLYEKQQEAINNINKQLMELKIKQTTSPTQEVEEDIKI